MTYLENVVNTATQTNKATVQGKLESTEWFASANKDFKYSISTNIITHELTYEYTS